MASISLSSPPSDAILEALAILAGWLASSTAGSYFIKKDLARFSYSRTGEKLNGLFPTNVGLFNSVGSKGVPITTKNSGSLEKLDSSDTIWSFNCAAGIAGGYDGGS